MVKSSPGETMGNFLDNRLLTIVAVAIGMSRPEDIPQGLAGPKVVSLLQGAVREYGHAPCWSRVGLKT